MKKIKLGTKGSIIIGVLILICYLGVFSSILVQVKSKSISDSEILAKGVWLSYAIHEETDMTWYNKPKELKGTYITEPTVYTALMARILSIADAYDAMVSYRPYRKTKTRYEAIEELRKYSGTQFDPKIVEIFIGKVIKNLD